MTSYRTLWLGVTVTAVFATGVVRGDDWPQWLGPQRDGVWRETGILEKFPETGPTIRWRVPVAAGYAGPAVAEGKIFLTDRVLAEGAKNPNEVVPSPPKNAIPGTERVLCFRETDGKLLWKHEYDCPYFVSYPLGPRTTPVARDGRVYTLGTEGNLLCLAADTGKVVWSKELKKEYHAKAPLWGFSAHLLLDGNKLISLVGGEGSAVVAFDRETGKELWRALTTKDIGYCPPMIYEAGGKRQLIIWHSEALSSLDPETGKVYWSEPQKTYMGMSISTPRKFGDTLFITGYPSCAVTMKLANDRPEAHLGWRWKEDKKKGLFSVFSTPFMEDGFIYGSTANGALACMNAETGERLWDTLQPNKGKKLSSADVFLIKNGDRFFIVTEQGDLIIAQVGPKGYHEISRAHVLDSTSTAWGREVVWSHPAFANKCVFMRNDKEVVCVSLAADAK